MNDELRFKVLRLVTEQPEISQRELATALGLSLGKAHYCIHALIDKGWLKVRNFTNSQHKLAYAYVLTPSGLRAKARVTIEFLRRKQDEYQQLEQEIRQLHQEVDRLNAAGSATARALRNVGAR